jgi:two-component system, sensor histidine kinase and response regulator
VPQRILIVDDYPSNLAVLRAGLESEGLDVLQAANGVQALAVLEREPVDAVISDILMPEMDGFRLCHEIRKSSKAYRSLPFILYTATYNSPSDRSLAATVGANDYIVKPAPVSVIMQALAKARQQSPPVGGAVERPADSYVLEQYSAALVRKLEERNTDLQQALLTLQVAHQQIGDLNQTLEERVAQRTLELTAANRALDSFSHSVAHDLRGPLSHVSMYADLLLEKAGPVLDAPCRSYVEAVLGAADRMDHLIRDLLAFSRSGRQELQLGDVELEAVLNDAIDVLQPDLRGRVVQWQRAPLPRARGDAALLRQVFVNLLSNALKYSRNRNPAIIQVDSRAGNEEIIVSVRDNGVGFDMQRVGELFTVFRRLHAAADFEGTGIGLASAHQIIARHGGRMWAESSPDQGATFCFSLPVA